MLNEKELIIKRVNDYAETITRTNIESLADFYTVDGVFIPDNYNTIRAVELNGNKAKNFLTSNEFKIEFSVKEVAISMDFAFVTAIAKSSSKNKQTNEKIVRTSRDFFVLKKVDTEWKIFRYLFNNVKILAV